MMSFFTSNIMMGDLKSWLFLLIFLNVYVYICSLLVFFSILFLTDVSLFKLTSNFKTLTQLSFSFNSLVFLFLTLAGLPPFLSFVGKFFFFVFLFYNTNVLVIFIFFLFNCFVIYFYIQHLRLLWTKAKSFPTFFKKNFFFCNFYVVYVIVFVLFFLIFGVFFIPDIFIYLSPFII